MSFAPSRSGVISLRLAVRMHSQARLRETPFALRGEPSRCVALRGEATRCVALRGEATSGEALRAAGVRRNFGLMREASSESPSVSEAGWGERAVPRGAEPPPSAARSSHTRAPGRCVGFAPARSGVISLRLAVRMHSQARLRETPFALRGEATRCVALGGDVWPSPLRARG